MPVGSGEASSAFQGSEKAWQMATRACSTLVAASAGAPMTSPAPKMGDAGAIVGIDGDHAALAGLQAGGGEVQRPCVAAASCTDEHAVAVHRRAGAEREKDGTGPGCVARGDALFPQEVDAGLDHCRVQCARDLGVEKGKQRVASVDQMDSHAERGKGACVFAADDTGADDDEFPGQVLEQQNLVGVVNAVVFKRELRRAHRG